METVNRDYQAADVNTPTLRLGERLGLNKIGLNELSFYGGFNTGVVAFAVGICIYFSVPFEPDWRWVAALGAFSGENRERVRGS